MRYVFWGTPEFAVIILRGLIDGGYIPSAVVTNPDKPVGRKHIITPPPIKQYVDEYCLRTGVVIPILQSEKIHDIAEQLRAFIPDIFIVAAYGKLIPPSILDIPAKGSINVHPSLLPRYRGPTPIQTSLLNGDKKSGVSVMLLDKQMDHGPILMQREAPIEKQNYLELSKEFAEMGAQLLLEAIPKWIEGKIQPISQNDNEATFTRIYTREDSFLDLTSSIEMLDRQIRALNPEPGTYVIKNGKRIKILKAHIAHDVLVLDTIQHEGKKAMICGKSLETFLSQ
ncbi:MAG: methionyl-tRNA formyltransferase [Patescibacteria group bacterium]|nr:methionyl-tRNA formyltransferase [Patescibacteria group bacterium]MDE2437865.1 methionyl-tRNA formyltransferase [Patescibacteria group bacterium]